MSPRTAEMPNRGGFTRCEPRPARPRLQRARRRRRRGIASVLAMLYMVLFSVLAIGFYAGTTLSAQVSRNERTIADAQLAAESGLAFMRYELGSMDLATGTPQAALLPAVAAELGRLMNGTQNMGGNTVQITGGSTIYVPSAAGYVTVEPTSGKKFRAAVAQSGTFLVLTVTGYSADPNVTRTVRVKYQQAPRASAIFDYGVASKGKIVTAGSSIIMGQGDPTRGSVLSTTTTDPTPIIIGGKLVSGDLSVTNPLANVVYTGASIGGTTDPAQIAANHLHKGVPTPDFPDIDTSPYTAFATTAWDGSSKTLTNVYIPANSNPKFTGSVTVNGVLLVKAPNKVNFAGNATIKGVIVVENGVPFDMARNQINFTGSVSASPIDSLDSSYPAAERALTGAFLLANNFSVSFSGDFGTVGGHIIASNINFSGNAGGVVKGSVINMADLEMDVNGSSDIIIASTGTSNYPTGVTFGVKYTPLPDTYVELP